jgi:hypothetical protein
MRSRRTAGSDISVRQDQSAFRFALGGLEAVTAMLRVPVQARILDSVRHGRYRYPGLVPYGGWGGAARTVLRRRDGHGSRLTMVIMAAIVVARRRG